ncbi:DUF6884 domain-containing protein [Streptomyces sp. NPDC088775]|uniref:DUF6884 domain-containing protein n=2 Tax=unclassified Streptomyces TaxID=2593676 RepID=UPI00381F9646
MNTVPSSVDSQHESVVSGDAGRPEAAAGNIAADQLDQLAAALQEGESIAAVSFLDGPKPAAGWVLTTAAGHAFRIRPVTYCRPEEGQWEAGHDADGSYWWATNIEDRLLAKVLARIRTDSATRARFAALWAKYGQHTAQAPAFGCVPDRVELEPGVFLIRRFGAVGLVAECRWGFEHLTAADGREGCTGEDWARKGTDHRRYVAEWKVWDSALESVANSRLRVVSVCADDDKEADVDAYCAMSAPYVGKCSAKRSGSRYWVAVVDDRDCELGWFVACARCLASRILDDAHGGSRFSGREVVDLAHELAKGGPKTCALHWQQWGDRATELCGQLLTKALENGEWAPWPSKALADALIAQGAADGDDRAKREARAAVRERGGDKKAQDQAADLAAEMRTDRAALVASVRASRASFSARLDAESAAKDAERSAEAGDRQAAEEYAGCASDHTAAAVEAATVADAAGYGPAAADAAEEAERVNEAARKAVAALAELAGSQLAKSDAAPVAGAPARLALPAGGQVAAPYDAARTMAALGWSAAFVATVRLAAAGGLKADASGFRAVHADGRTGRRVKGERVRLLARCGYLARHSSGLVVATEDGHEALRLAEAAGPSVLRDDADVMASVRKARRARQWDSHTGQDAHALPVLPGGGEERRRLAAARKGAERAAVEAEKTRKRTEALMRRARIRDRREARREAAREAEARAPRRCCRGVWPMDWRCGECRELAARGIEDFPALPAGSTNTQQNSSNTGGLGATAGKRRITVKRITDGLWHAITRGEVYTVVREDREVWPWVIVAPNGDRIGSPSVIDGEFVVEDVRDIVRRHADGEPAAAPGAGSTSEPSAADDGSDAGPMAVGEAYTGEAYTGGAFARAAAFDLAQTRWGVECTRHAPVTVWVDKFGDGTEYESAAMQFDNRADAELAAQLHADDHARRDEGVVTPAEIEKAAALSFSRGQWRAMGWICEGKVQETRGGFKAYDVSPDRADVSARIKRDRIPALWSAGYVRVFAVAPGVRSFSLTEDGERAYRLWSRVMKAEAVTEPETDSAHVDVKGQPYRLLSARQYWPGETPVDEEAEKAETAAAKEKAARLDEESKRLPAEVVALISQAETSGRWTSRTLVHPASAAVVQVHDVNEERGRVVRMLWTWTPEGWEFSTGGTLDGKGDRTELKAMSQARAWVLDAVMFAGDDVTLDEDDDQSDGGEPLWASREFIPTATPGTDAEIIEIAAAGLLWQRDGDKFAHAGRMVSPARVLPLIEAGTLYRSADGRVYPVKDNQAEEAEQPDGAAQVEDQAQEKTEAAAEPAAVATAASSPAARYRFGVIDTKGRTAVFVDGAEVPAGVVWDTGRGVKSWTARGIGKVAHTSTMHKTRTEAAAAIVELAESAARAAVYAASQADSTAYVPEGWKAAAWDEIECRGLRTVRLIEEDKRGQVRRVGLSVKAWTLRKITRYQGGRLVITGTPEGEKSLNVSVIDAPWSSLGALVPDDITPDPVGAPWWVPGQAVMRPEGADTVRAPETVGTVVQVVSDFNTGTRTLRADFGGSSASVPIDVDANEAEEADDARVIIVPCGGKKAETAKGQPVDAAPAGELYTGSYHAATRKAAKQLARPGDRIVIMSARFGLVDLTEWLPNYDLRAGDPGTVDADTLKGQAARLWLHQRPAVVLAGKAYTELARHVWADAVNPLDGCAGMGEQLARLARLGNPADVPRDGGAGLGPGDCSGVRGGFVAQEAEVDQTGQGPEEPAELWASREFVRTAKPDTEAEVIEWAGAGLLWQNGDGFRHAGRKVNVSRVLPLIEAGTLHRSGDGRVYPTQPPQPDKEAAAPPAVRPEVPAAGGGGAAPQVQEPGPVRVPDTFTASGRTPLTYDDLDGWTYADFVAAHPSEEDTADLVKLAGPGPVRWLFAPAEGDAPRAVNLFGGCGGWCVGIRRILGAKVDMLCIDASRDATATATRAGCHAICADVRSIDPEHFVFQHTQILIGSSPCIDFTNAGKRAGRLPENVAALVDAIEQAGAAVGNYIVDGPGCTCVTDEECECGPEAYDHFGPRSGDTWDEIRSLLADMPGAETAGLMLEPMIWALALKHGGAPLHTILFEQSNQLPQEIRDVIKEELYCAGESALGAAVSVTWEEIDAAAYGSPSTRRRAFMMATFGRYNSGPVAPEITITADQATGLAADLEVITRGARKTSGGNAFVMGRVIPGVTSRIRSVDVGHKGGRFTLEQVAALVTLPREYAALAEGSRTSICQQFADIVAPVVSAAVFGETVGHIFGIKRNRGGWLPLLLAYLREQYPGAKAVLNTKSATPEAGGPVAKDRRGDTFVGASEGEQTPRGPARPQGEVEPPVHAVSRR